MIHLLAITLLLLPVFAVGAFASGHAREWHHFYIGLVLAVLTVAHVAPMWLGWIGVAIMADDAVQHIVQISRPKFISPLHWLYRHLIYNPWQRLKR